jgi:hypothetical protein
MVRTPASKIRETNVSVGGWWWLNFEDPNSPKGSQFLGVAIVEATDLPSAIGVAQILGINPGGEADGVEIRPERLPPAAYRNRLLSRIDVKAMVERRCCAT